MKVILGLGNPEVKYFKTRHNIGFMAVDKLAEKLGVEFSKKDCKAVIAESFIKGEKVVLAKPLTYMNLSGESVKEFINKYKLSLADIMVVYDDMDLDIGTLRLKQSGSAGTHNGMKNIVQELKSDEFMRMRVGIGKPGDARMGIIAFVLGEFSKEEKELVDEGIDVAVSAIEEYLNGKSIDRVIEQVNRRKR